MEHLFIGGLHTFHRKQLPPVWEWTFEPDYPLQWMYNDFHTNPVGSADGHYGTEIRQGVMAILHGYGASAPERRETGDTRQPPLPHPQGDLCIGRHYEWFNVYRGLRIVRQPHLQYLFACLQHSFPIILTGMTCIILHLHYKTRLILFIFIFINWYKSRNEGIRYTFPLIHFCVIKHIPIFAQVKRKAKPKLVFSRY